MVNRLNVTLLALIPLGLVACGGVEPQPSTPDPTVSDTPQDAPVEGHPGADMGYGDGASVTPNMGALDLLRRASLDLRGVLPSEDELAAVEADHASVDAMVHGFLNDARFGGRVRDLWAPIYQTRLDYFSLTASSYGLDDAPAFNAAVGEEPLQILGYIAEHDLPYTELVTGDWTMANETLAEAWSLDYPEDSSGWQRSYYTDERPAAGVLATNGLWWRYGSTYSNANRGRANAVSKMLLCSDYLSKPIAFDRNVNLLDGGAVNDALKNNEGCLACHYSLDTFAAYFWGFYYNDIYSRLDMTTYHAEREYLYDAAVGTAPGYYGTPGYNLNDLGKQIAGDNRYPACFVEQAFKQLNGRDVDLDDTDTRPGLRDTFMEGGLPGRPVIPDVIDGADYRAGESRGGEPAYRKMMTPEILASALEDLTGFRFTYYGYDLMGTDTYGLRTLAGGVDGQFVTSPATEPTATMLLAHERLAQAAAWYAVEHDRENPDSPRLFRDVSFTETLQTDREAFVAQVVDLHWRIFGHRIDSDGQEVEANLELWQELYEADGDAGAAWAGLLSVLLRDPDFFYY